MRRLDNTRAEVVQCSLGFNQAFTLRRQIDGLDVLVMLVRIEKARK